MNLKTKFALYAESVSMLNESSRISCQSMYFPQLTHKPSAAPLHLWRQTCCINLLYYHTALNQQMSNASHSPPHLSALQPLREKSPNRPMRTTRALVQGHVSLCLTPINHPKERKKERENSRSHLWSWTRNGSLIKLEGCPAAKAANPITSLHLLARNLIRFLIQLSAWSWAELARPGRCCLCPLLRELEKGFKGEESFPADPGERTPSAGSQANWSQINTQTR